MALITDIAEAVVAELNAGSFSLPFTAARHYRPVFELEEMQTLHVTVVPKGTAIQPNSRNSNQHDIDIDVAIQQKLETADNTDIDPLMTLVDEIADQFRFKRLNSFPNAVWVKTENQPVYAQEHLDQLRQFTSLLTLTFRVIR